MLMTLLTERRVSLITFTSSKCENPNGIMKKTRRTGKYYKID